MLIVRKSNFLLVKRAFFSGFLWLAYAQGQIAQPEKPPMADEVFKNIQVLKGLTVDQFMGTMGFISAALNMNCSDCHDATNSAAYALDTPLKRTARRMIVMVNNLNKNNFAGRREVTCYSCHRADVRPRVTPRLSDQYGTPPPEDPNEIQPRPQKSANAATADQIFDKYIQALGGAQRLAALTSFIGHGTYEGFDTDGDKVPVDVYAKAPNLRSTVVHLRAADNVRTFDGRNYWTTSAGTLLPLPVITMSGGELEGAKLDSALAFPAQIKQLSKEWRTGFPTVTIDDNEVDVVQGTNADGTPIRFYFDKKSGLLVRQVRFTEAALGLNPVQIDYSDYRDAAGVKVPFHWVFTWTDGRSTTELSSLEPNVAISASQFARPMALVRRAP